MKELAPDLWQLDGRPADLVNTYVLGDVLIDAGTRFDGGRILRQVEDRGLSAHALTHAHPDHLGSSHAVCERMDVPFWVGSDDVAVAEDPRGQSATLLPRSGAASKLPLQPLTWLVTWAGAGPGHPVSRRLREGDQVGGFEVLETPGHTSGHLAFWRAEDRALVAGDVLWNFQFAAGKPGLTTPAATSNVDSAQNRASARRLAELEPSLVCFGHGPPLRDTRRFVDFIASLPMP